MRHPPQQAVLVVQPAPSGGLQNLCIASLLDSRRLNVEWDSCRKMHRYSHFLISRFLARAPHGDAVPICAHVVSRQVAWQPHTLPRPSCACQPVVETLSELHPNASSSSYVPLRPWVSHNISFNRHPFRFFQVPGLEKNEI